MYTCRVQLGQLVLMVVKDKRERKETLVLLDRSACQDCQGSKEMMALQGKWASLDHLEHL